MGASVGVTGTIQDTVYVSFDAADQNDPAGNTDTAKWASAVGDGKLVSAKNKLGECLSAGPITLSGNSTSYTVLGEDTEQQIAAPAGLDEMPVRFAIAESVTVDSAIADANIGDKVVVGILKRSNKNEAERTLYHCRGEIASLEFSFDTPNDCGLTLALAKRPTRIHQAG